MYRIIAQLLFVFSKAYLMTSVEHLAVRINAVRVGFVVIARGGL